VFRRKSFKVKRALFRRNPGVNGRIFILNFLKNSHLLA
jgi:hypothetical protein